MPVCVYCVCVCVVSALCLCVCAKVLLFCIEFICLFCQPLDPFAPLHTPLPLSCLNPLPGCGNYVTIKLPDFWFFPQVFIKFTMAQGRVKPPERRVCKVPFCPLPNRFPRRPAAALFFPLPSASSLLLPPFPILSPLPLFIRNQPLIGIRDDWDWGESKGKRKLTLLCMPSTHTHTHTQQ